MHSNNPKNDSNHNIDANDFYLAPCNIHMHQQLIAKDFHITLQPGDAVALIGLNGVGKSSLLQYLVGFLQKNGTSFAYAPQQLGFHPNLYWPDALKLLPLAPDYRSYLRAFNIKNAPISHLSQGNQQLVNVLLTLMQQAKIVLLDEPMNHLDWRNQKNILQAIAHKKKQSSLLIATHYIEQITPGNGYTHVLFLKGLGAWEWMDIADFHPINSLYQPHDCVYN